MITRQKATLLQALVQSGPKVETATPGKAKIVEAERVDTPLERELVKRMQVISLSSDSEQYDDCSEEDSDSDYEEEASVMDLSGDDELTTEKDEESEVVQANTSDSINSLISEKVLQIIKGDESKKLTLDYCRSYLRHHGMRISGNKPVLIDRIKQHIELKQGPLEKYRPATFTINCTGDVCKGDVIKFKRRVYKAGSVSRKSAEAIGEHLVVGRVVKESYGEKKQQHTFTVEVLWSAGYKPLPPMRQLLVKGRNLYKLRTYRQKWENEGLRKMSLDEKHERGAAARSKRRDTLRASGRRKAATGTRKQLPNPYVAMGVSGNPQPHLLGEIGNVGRGEPLQQGWFPEFPMVHEQPYLPPRKETVPQLIYSNLSRVDAHQHHVNPPVVVAGQRDARLNKNIPSGVEKRVDEYQQHINPPAGVAGQRDVGPINNTPREVERRVDGCQHHIIPPAGVAGGINAGLNNSVPSEVRRIVDGYQHHINPPAGVVGGRRDTRLYHNNPSGVERRVDGYHHHNSPPAGAAGRRDAGLNNQIPSGVEKRVDGYQHHINPSAGVAGQRDVGFNNNVLSRVQFPPLQPPKRTHVSCPTAGCKNYASKVCSYGVCLKCCKEQGRICQKHKH
ncbi:hypothetical protein Mapa_017211 [Marchantia paleacea]|nr:hypothetical protein Mapa_017211 [Marchantia paleacea]